MQPEPDAMLELVARKLIEQVLPHVDDYLKGDLQLLALTIRAAAERFDVAADVLMREHLSMDAIFRCARDCPGLADTVPAGSLEVASFRLAELRTRNHQELECLIRLDERLEAMTAPPEGLKQAVEDFLRGRVVLHAFNASPYLTAGLADAQRTTMKPAA